MNWIIGTLVVVGFLVALLAILFYLASRAITQIEEQECRPQSSHEPMDLRLPEKACDRCIRWGECNGVDKDNCPLCKAEKDLWQCENT